MSTNFKLWRRDGKLYLHRRGIECRWFGIYIHRIGAPDPGTAPHNHPWWFCSWILRGGYEEKVWNVNPKTDGGRLAHKIPYLRVRNRWSWRAIGKNQAHHIIEADPDTVTLVFRGRRFRDWGFFDPTYTYWEDMPRDFRDLSYEEPA